MPGSRDFEVAELLPEFCQSIKHLKQKYSVKVHMVKSPSVNPELFNDYEDMIDFNYSDEELVKAFQNTDLCLAASGTVTLATALFEIPTVICYRSSLLNVYIFDTFISYKGPIGLCNIVHQEYVRPELVQDGVSSFNIRDNLEKWLSDKDNFIKTKDKLKKTKLLILGEGLDVPEYMAKVLNGATN